MAQITALTEGSCLCVKVVGRLSPNEIVATMKEHYGVRDSYLRIWDLVDADFGALVDEDLVAVAKELSVWFTAANAGRTALVTENFRAYALLTRYLLHAFQNEVHEEYRVFSAIEEAWEWLHCPQWRRIAG